MAGTQFFGQLSPQLSIKEIADLYVQKNFQNLSNYFRDQNQLLNFKFFEVVFTGPTTNYKLAHGLGLIPQDIIVTKGIGTGNVYFNHGLFTSTQLDITVTAACRIRFFVGAYYGFQSAIASSTLDKQLLTLDAPASTITSTVPTGVVLDWAGSSLPSWGALWCDGASYLIATYPTLFQTIGWTYGKPDINHFNVPDRRGRSPVGKDDIGGTAAGRVTTSVSGVDGLTLGAVGGAQSVTLDTTMIPSHNHTQNAHNHTQNAHTHAVVIWGAGVTATPNLICGTTTAANSGVPDPTYFAPATATNQATTATNNATGGGLAHNNMGPVQVTNFIIKT